jgi:preprotein translocase subunit YajC
MNNISGFNNAILLMATAPGQPLWKQFLPLILIGVVFYFFILRPQLKKTKQAKQFRESLKKGDKIITIGGLHGKIVETAETTFLIETEGGVKLRFEKSAVSSSVTDQLAEQQGK